MRRFTTQLYQNIEKSIDRLPSDPDDKSRRLFYLVFLILGPPAMVLFGINGLVKGDWFLFSSLLVLAGGVILGWAFLLKPKNGLLAYRINSLVYALILFYVVYIGGQGGSKILWSYTFPLIVIFLFSKKEGIVWCAVYLAAVLMIIAPDWHLHGQFMYHAEFKFRFTFTYLMVSSITYWFEHLRQSYRGRLESKNRRLESQIDQNIKIQEEVMESERLFRSIFDQAGVGVSLTCSKTGRLLKVNRKYCDILGYSVEELEKITFQSITHPDDVGPDLENLNNLRAGKIDSYSMEKRHIGPDGSIIWVHLSVSPTSRKRDQHIGIIQDITARKLLEAEVKTLEGIIPICSGCKKIRDDEGYWNRIESYIQEHSDASFSHGMCPECTDKLYGDEDWYIKMKKKEQGSSDA